MRIVFLGSPEFVISPLESLLSSSHEVVAVVSQAAKQLGRNAKTEVDPPVAQFAKAKNILCLQPEKARDPEFLEQLARLKPDLCVTAAYGKILTQDFLNIPKRGTINIHPSKLPEYRGATPVAQALLDAKTKTAVSILFTVKELDAGNIIIQKDFDISPQETTLHLNQRLFKESGPLLLEAIEKLTNENFAGTPQDSQRISFCQKFSKEDGLIKWQEPAKTIIAKFRAFDPWPGIYTYLKDKRIIISEIDFMPARNQSLSSNEMGGFTFKKELQAIMVNCGSDFLLIKKLKPEGSKIIDAAAFWNGLRDKSHPVFGSLT